MMRLLRWEAKTTRPNLYWRSAVVFLICCLPVCAQDEGQAPEEITEEDPSDSDDSIEFRISYYDNDDSGDGNPFLDESETVIEPALVLELAVTEDVTLTASLQYDQVSAASIERLQKYPEQSGASKDNYIGGDVGVSVQVTEDLRLGARVGGSNEYDYSSLNFGIDASMDFNQKNTTLSLSGNLFLDQVRVIRWNGAETLDYNGQPQGDEDRTTYTGTLGLYQVLTPTVHMTAGYTFTHQNGFLETAFNSIVMEDPSDPPNLLLDNLARGVEATEELPYSRQRHALYGRVRKYFETGTSVEVGGRLYTDSWGITSEALELRLYQWVVDETFEVRVRYRYYTQSAADDFEDHFFVPPSQRALFQATAERTQDSDLGDFDSNTVGVRLRWFVSDVILDLGVDYVLRSDGIDQLLVSFGVKVEF